MDSYLTGLPALFKPGMVGPGLEVAVLPEGIADRDQQARGEALVVREAERREARQDR